MHICEYCTEEATVDWNTDEGLTQVCDAHGTMIDDVQCGWPWNTGKASNADTAPAAGAVWEPAAGLSDPFEPTEGPAMRAFLDKRRDQIANLPDDTSGIEGDGTP